MTTLSDLYRGRYCKCTYCTDCDIFGRCTKLNKSVDWYIKNNILVRECPKKRRKKEGF